MNSRNRQYDIARGIAMMLVVLGHCHQRQIEVFVCLFHMPVFLFISGFFWKDENINNPIGFFKKRFKGLYLPYLCYEIIFFFLRPVFLALGWYDAGAVSWNFGVGEVLKEIIKIVLLMGREQLLGAFWYLVMLLMLEIGYWIISYIVHKIFNDREDFRFGFIFLVWIIGCLLSRHIAIPRIGSALIGLPFFYIGYLTKKYQVNLKYTSVTCFASLIFLIVSVIFGSAAIGSVTIHDPAFQLLCGCVGIYLVMSISKRIESNNWKWSLIFDFVGTNTITVMAFHEIGFKLLTTMLCFTALKSQLNLSAIPVGNNGLIFVLPYFLTAIAFSCFAIWLKQRLKALGELRGKS